MNIEEKGALEPEDKNYISIQGFEQLFDINLNLLCVANFEGIILQVNKQWERILGFSQEEILGRNIREFIVSEHLSVRVPAAKQTAAQWPSNSFTYNYIIFI
jgi:PAS domain S-box-containing protein